LYIKLNKNASYFAVYFIDWGASKIQNLTTSPARWSFASNGGTKFQVVIPRLHKSSNATARQIVFRALAISHYTTNVADSNINNSIKPRLGKKLPGFKPHQGWYLCSRNQFYRPYGGIHMRDWEISGWSWSTGYILTIQLASQKKAQAFTTPLLPKKCNFVVPNWSHRWRNR